MALRCHSRAVNDSQELPTGYCTITTTATTTTVWIQATPLYVSPTRLEHFMVVAFVDGRTEGPMDLGAANG
jgi:hypothetical protein